jgi:glycerophosphoryl diester phosphodiesterase
MFNIRLSAIIILSAWLMTGCKENDDMLIIGHRGAMGYVTENTLPSIQKALDMEVDMIEIDVFRIRTGELVVFHDENVDKLTDGEGPIEEMSWDEVRALEVNGGYQIPSLDEVVRLIDGRVPLNIELKGAGTARPVHEWLAEYSPSPGWIEDHIVISSFRWEELDLYRTLDPDMPIAVLTEADPTLALIVARELSASAIKPNYKGQTANQVAEVQREGYKVYTYTVNEPEDIEHMREIGVDGIFTNFPDRAR